MGFKKIQLLGLSLVQGLPEDIRIWVAPQKRSQVSQT